GLFPRRSGRDAGRAARRRAGDRRWGVLQTLGLPGERRDPPGSAGDGRDAGAAAADRKREGGKRARRLGPGVDRRDVPGHVVRHPVRVAGPATAGPARAAARRSPGDAPPRGGG
ncbi:MAG: hypothetical protein ACK55Z_14250, partial [bacterium]